MNLRARMVIALWVCALVPSIGSALAAWALLSDTNSPAAQAAFDPVLLAIVASAAVGCAMATLLGWLLSPQVARPIRAAMEAADRIAAGTRSVRIDTKAGGEAGRLVMAFNRMARELDAAESRLRAAERIAAWREIARQMAHEIKNPLTPIQMAVEMLRKAKARQLEDFDELFDEQTTIVLEEVARLRRLVENFSRFARSPRPRPQRLDVSEVVEHVVVMHAAAGVEVTGEVEGKPPTINADREQLTQVLVNLVGNAVHAAKRAAEEKKGRTPAVHVTVRDAGDNQVAIAVDDNGGGVDESVKDRLFEPYVTTKKGEGGTGLGLAIAYRIAHEHNGALTVDSSAEGTRFELTLPVGGPTVAEVTVD